MEIEYLVLLQEMWAREMAGVDATEAASALQALVQASAASGAIAGAEVPLDAPATALVARDGSFVAPPDGGLAAADGAAKRAEGVGLIGADILALGDGAVLGQRYVPPAAARAAAESSRTGEQESPPEADWLRFARQRGVEGAKAEEVALLLLPLPFAEGGDNRVWLTAGRSARILQLQADGTFVAHGRELFIADWSRERWALTGRLYLQRVAVDGAGEAAEMGDDEFTVQTVIIICQDPCNPGPCCFMNCNDGNACTIDSCQWGVCHYTNRECPDDGQFCNGVESCNTATGCVSSGDPCAPLQCKESTDECVECTADGHCDDGDECTDNLCIDDACTFPPRQCNDWQFCNGVESCDPATGCVAGTPPCPSWLICDEALDRCVECFGHDDCDDGNACTYDICSNTTCQFPPRDCDDGQFCNGVEWCDWTTGCQSGTRPCPAALCNEFTDECAACSSDAQCDDGNPCTVNTCSLATGMCTTAPSNCSDGNPCTTDGCDPGTGDCTHTHRCDQYGDDPCDEICTCDPSTGQLTLLPPCDDGNACTWDWCDHYTGTCGHGDYSDWCPVGQCGCFIGAGCDPAVGCVWSHTCDDGDPCTIDECWCYGAWWWWWWYEWVECDEDHTCTCFHYPSNDPCCAEPELCCGGELGLRGEDPCCGASANLTAFYPQSEAYGAPFARTPIPDNLEEASDRGVGIRINGDDDDGDQVPDRQDPDVPGENDLIEVVIDLAPATAPAGLEYSLKRTGTIRAWRSRTKGVGTEIVFAEDRAALSPSDHQQSIWIEATTAGEAWLEVQLRRTSDGEVLPCGDKLRFYTFRSIVIALGGEGQNPTDPVTPGQGTFTIARQLYRRGYDVHMYNEDAVDSEGNGIAYSEVVRGITRRGVSSVCIFGYSHGGGSTHDLAERLNANRSTIQGTFSIVFTGYVDAVTQPGLGSEERRPPGTSFHLNMYQPCTGFEVLCGEPTVPPANEEVDVSQQPWGQQLDHYSIDDQFQVTDLFVNRITARTSR